MFSGIVEGTGIVKDMKRKENLFCLAVKSPLLNDVKIGDSISINGACLTATAVNKNEVMFDVSFETQQKTTLGNLRINDKINIERPLKAGDKIGGHFVTGHVDGIGQIVSIIKKEDIIFEIKLQDELKKYLVEKGSISIDGISLTIAEIKDGFVKIVVIPHTLKVTTLGFKKVGDKVNIEVDMLAKLAIEKTAPAKAPSKITEDFLKEHGLM